MADMPGALRRRMLLTYLGYPFYDAVTLPLLRGEGQVVGADALEGRLIVTGEIHFVDRHQQVRLPYISLSVA